jgi:hypothetical protein
MFQSVPESVASLLVESAILLGNLLGEISDQGDGDTTDTTLLAGSVDLGEEESE